MRNLNRLKVKRVMDTSLYFQALRLKRLLFKISFYLAILLFITVFLGPSLELIYIALTLALLLLIMSCLVHEGSLDDFIVRHIQRRKSYT